MTQPTQPMRRLLAALNVAGEQFTGTHPDGPERGIWVSRWRTRASVLDGGGWLECTLHQQRGDELRDWALAEAATLKKMKTDQTILPTRLGLDLMYATQSDWYRYRVFWLDRIELDASGKLVTVRGLENKILHRRLLKAPAQNKSPQQLAAAILDEIGYGNYYVLRLPDKPLRHHIQAKVTAADALRGILDSVNIPYGWHFAADGKFVWQPWTVDYGLADGLSIQGVDAEEIPLFVYQQDIVELKAIVEDETEDPPVEEKQTPTGAAIDDYYANAPTGSEYEMRAYPQTQLWPGRLIIVDGHPHADGVFRIDTIEQQGGDISEALLRIREVN